MNDKYVVSYCPSLDLWDVRTLKETVYANVDQFLDDSDEAYAILFIGNSHDEAMEAMRLFKKAKKDLAICEELRNKIIQFPNKNIQD